MKEFVKVRYSQSS